MKNKLLMIIGVLSVMLTTACSSGDEDEDVGNWIELSELDGAARSNAVAFVVGDYAYVGTGYNSKEDDYYTDFWKYDPSLNYWTKIDAFPGVARSSGVAFAIGDKGYVGIGSDGDDELDDFWEYNTTTQKWTQITPFGGGPRRGSVAFSVNGKGYVGGGYYDGSNLKDFYQYDPTRDSASAWEAIPSIGGSKFVDGFCFVIDNKAYVGGGSNNSLLVTTFYQFDDEKLNNGEFPWVKKLDLTEEDDYTIAREKGTAFAMGGKGYVTVGSNGYSTNTVWEYNPSLDTWEEKTSFEGSARYDAVSFTVNDRGFVSLGRNGTNPLSDIWEFKPFDEYDDED